MKNKTTVVHHSADYDGIFCRQIAKKFLPDAELIGWDFGQDKIPWPEGIQTIYVLDLPPDCLDLPDINVVGRQMIWIDHHKSAIDKWPNVIPGYRIDGVAASRLAWAWFTSNQFDPQVNPTDWVLPTKEDFIARIVSEPEAVRLVGEYDVWQHDPSNGDDITFQFGLDAGGKLDWDILLSSNSLHYLGDLLRLGHGAQKCYRKRDAEIVIQRGFDLDFMGLRFIALNTARCNSQTFEAAVKPQHDGCCAFYWNGKQWIVSLYGVPHKPELDLSKLAITHGGGGHKQACGFTAKSLPWL